MANAAEISVEISGAIPNAASTFAGPAKVTSIIEASFSGLGLEDQGPSSRWIDASVFGEILVLVFRDPGHSFVHDPLADAVVGFSIDFVGDLRVQTPLNEHRVVAHIEQVAAFGTVCSELRRLFDPQSVHV